MTHEPFDATDLEIARREHAAEMGESSNSERAWLAWCDRAEAKLAELGWDETFTGDTKAGQSRGLDGADDEDGYSIDSAYYFFERGETVETYVALVKANREALGLLRADPT